MPLVTISTFLTEFNEAVKLSPLNNIHEMIHMIISVDNLRDSKAVTMEQN